MKPKWEEESAFLSIWNHLKREKNVQLSIKRPEMNHEVSISLCDLGTHSSLLCLSIVICKVKWLHSLIIKSVGPCKLYLQKSKQDEWGWSQHKDLCHQGKGCWLPHSDTSLQWCQGLGSSLQLCRPRDLSAYLQWTCYLRGRFTIPRLTRSERQMINLQWEIGLWW